jgi:hypothetical protein
MNQRRKRAVRWLTLAAATTAAGLAFAPSASAHTVEPLPDPSPTNVAGNTGNGLDYLLNELQHGHLNAPLLGLGPAIEDPVGYTGSHVLPVGIETVERIGGISQTDAHAGEEPPAEEPPAEEPGHGH